MRVRNRIRHRWLVNNCSAKETPGIGDSDYGDGVQNFHEPFDACGRSANGYL